MMIQLVSWILLALLAIWCLRVMRGPNEDGKMSLWKWRR